MDMSQYQGLRNGGALYVSQTIRGKNKETLHKVSAQQTLGGTYILYNQDEKQIDTAITTEEMFDKLSKLTREAFKYFELLEQDAEIINFPATPETLEQKVA